MFKRIAERIRPSKPQYTDRISIKYGEILSQGDCDSILVFMLPNLVWGGELNKALLKQAGPALDEFVLTHATTPRSGEVFAAPGFNSSYKKIFVAILAQWDGGNGFEERDLMNCYRHAITMAQSLDIKNIAIPALGRDKRDFPHIRFARVAIKAMLEVMDQRMERVTVFCVDRRMFNTYSEQMLKVQGKAAS